MSRTPSNTWVSHLEHPAGAVDFTNPANGESLQVWPLNSRPAPAQRTRSNAQSFVSIPIRGPTTAGNACPVISAIGIINAEPGGGTGTEVAIEALCTRPVEVLAIDPPIVPRPIKVENLSNHPSADALPLPCRIDSARHQLRDHTGKRILALCGIPVFLR